MCRILAITQLHVQPYDLATTLYLSQEDAGPSQIGSLTVRLTIHPDNEPSFRGKQRIVSEVKEDINSKLRNRLFRPESRNSANLSALLDLSKSLKRILFGLSVLSKVMGSSFQVYSILSS